MIKSNFLNLLNKFNKTHRGRLSRSEFCRLTGISRSIAMRLYNGQENGLKYDTIDKLVKFFQVSPGALVTFTDKPIHLILENADKDLTQSAINHSSNDDLDMNPCTHGILMQLDDGKYSICVELVPCPPGDFDSLIDDTTSYFSFDYQVIDPRGFADCYDTVKLSYNRHFRYIFNHHFSSRLFGYIYSRMLLHSGFLSRHGHKQLSVDGRANISEWTDDVGYYLHFKDFLFKDGVDGLIHLWKRQPVEHDKNNQKYRLISSQVGQPIKIYDYTTNYFK